MLKFCRSCGKELANPQDKVCKSCGANAIKATAHCRYCGHPTNVDDTTCGYCGSAVKPLPSSMRSLFEYPRLSARMGKIVNLTLVVLLITTYIILALPKAIKRPIQAKAADVVFASTGYSALPLVGLSTWPTKIPMINDAPGNAIYFRVGNTSQLSAFAIYKNTDANATANVTKATRIEEVTANCTFVSLNTSVATVTQGGLVTAVADGKTFVIVSYTAVPGSSNMSAASRAEGRKPITVTFNVTVKVPN